MRPLLTERRKDQLATALIRAGGLLVILVVVGIVINIGSEAVPLFQRAAQGPVEVVAEGGNPLLAGSDPRRDVVWVLDRDGTIRFPGAHAFENLEIAADSISRLAAADQEIHGLLSAISDRIVAMDQGAIVATGVPQAVLNDPVVVASYLGTDPAAIDRSNS